MTEVPLYTLKAETTHKETVAKMQEDTPPALK
jgi:hypothetical protein